jgi:hypothetical protein
MALIWPMRHVIHIIFAAVLVTLVTGCDGMHRNDARLMEADSIMWDAPDSALAVLSAIDSLSGEANQAYRDLLATQARYKCYQEITASDDSAITRAISHYRRHSGEREKLTRAYLYKGAVMEELGHVDSAMYYYKTAEVNADEKDFTNLGQINTRIADLYRIHNGNAQTCFEKYQLAFHNYVLARNKRMQLNSIYAMYMMNGITQPQLKNNDTIFTKAINLAIELGNDNKLFNLYELRCRQLSLSDSSCLEAKRVALKCLKDFESYINNDLLLDLAYLYAKESKLDSAKHFLKSVNESLSPGDEVHVIVRKNDVLSMIAEREGNVYASRHYIALNSSLTDSIMDDTDKYDLDAIENEFNLHKHKNILYEITHLQQILLWLTFITILLVALLAFYHYRRVHRYDKIIDSIKRQSASQLNDLTLLKHNIENLKIQDQQLKSFISSHLNLTSKMIEACYHSPQSKLSEQVKKIVRFQHENKQQWTQLYHYIDAEYNGIISKTRNAYPQLNEKDLLLIALTTTGFSYVQIAIIMGYTNATSIGTIKQRLAQKMHLDGSLNDYINSMVES